MKNQRKGKQQTIPFRKLKCYITLAASKGDSSCCAVDNFMHSSLNLAFTQCKSHNLFIFGIAFSVRLQKHNFSYDDSKTAEQIY